MSTLDILLGTLEHRASKLKGGKRESALNALMAMRQEYEQLRGAADGGPGLPDVTAGMQGPHGPSAPWITSPSGSFGAPPGIPQGTQIERDTDGVYRYYGPPPSMGANGGDSIDPASLLGPEGPIAPAPEHFHEWLRARGGRYRR